MRTPLVLFLGSLLVVGCGGSSDDKSVSSPLLDPSTKHYGKTYDDLAAAWVTYVTSYSPPDCLDPIADTTGKNCGLYQDPTSDVFLLVGSYGGPIDRTECTVPAGKALFFPLVDSWGDNTGIPADKVVSDAQVKSIVEADFAGMKPDTMHAVLDGAPIPDVQRGGISSAPYVLHVPTPPNSYTCQNVTPPVEGDFPGYVGGYFAFLSPLAAGSHTLEFGGTFGNQGGGGDTIISVQYTLTQK
jgi:hypothetical protein